MALSAFRLRVVRQRCLRQWRQHWDEELGEEAVELSAIGFGTDQGEGSGTGQAGVRDLEEGSQPSSAQARPMRNATDGGFTSELG